MTFDVSNFEGRGGGSLFCSVSIYIYFRDDDWAMDHNLFHK